MHALSQPLRHAPPSPVALLLLPSSYIPSVTGTLSVAGGVLLVRHGVGVDGNAHFPWSAHSGYAPPTVAAAHFDYLTASKPSPVPSPPTPHPSTLGPGPLDLLRRHTMKVRFAAVLGGGSYVRGASRCASPHDRTLSTLCQLPVPLTMTFEPNYPTLPPIRSVCRRRPIS